MIEDEFAIDFVTHLPENISVDDLIAGEGHVPEKVSKFVRNIFYGATIESEQNQN